ncbi:MAG: TIR domain-containing protein [Porphyromonadaceae bacterium]|nr:TIR domain-containing protein [Porphyromonadaceae bacterium]
MALINCFWSYAHSDQEHDGRILKLVEDVIGEFKAIVGEDVESYFVDKEKLRWGDDWPKELDKYIDNMPIFIPIITPAYFNRPSCTYELRSFISKLDERFGNENNSLMPIIYIDVPDLRNDQCNDELKQRISNTQYIDWTSNRFEETTSKAYRLGVHEIAKALRAKNEKIEKISIIPEINDASEDEEEVGILEKMSLLDVVAQDVINTMSDASTTAQSIAKIINEELDSFNQRSSNKNASVLLSTFNRLSDKLIEPVDDMYEKAEAFADKMSMLNSSVPALIQFMELMDPSDLEQRKSICNLKKSLLYAGENIKDLANSISKNIEVIEPFAKMSRSLRPIIRKLGKAFNLMTEVLIAYEQGVLVLETWDIDCDEEISLEEKSRDT